MPALEFVGTVELRNRHLVYRESHDFRVKQEGRHGDEHSCAVPRVLVDFLEEKLRGRKVTVAEATTLVVPRADAMVHVWVQAAVPRPGGTPRIGGTQESKTHEGWSGVPI